MFNNIPGSTGQLSKKSQSGARMWFRAFYEVVRVETAAPGMKQ